MPVSKEIKEAYEEIRDRWKTPLQVHGYTDVDAVPLESSLFQWKHKGITNERVPPKDEGVIAYHRGEDDAVVVRPAEITESDNDTTEFILNGSPHKASKYIEERVYVTPGAEDLPPEELLTASSTELKTPRGEVPVRKVKSPNSFLDYLEDK